LGHVDEGSTARGAPAVDVVAAPLLGAAEAIGIEHEAVLALQASVPTIPLEAVGVDDGALVGLVKVVS